MSGYSINYSTRTIIITSSANVGELITLLRGTVKDWKSFTIRLEEKKEIKKV